MKFLSLMLIVAAFLWAASELLEWASSGRTTVSLVLTAAFHQLMVFGIWGACLGREPRRGPLALLGALLVSIGYLVMVYPPLAVVSDPSLTIEVFMDARPLFKVFSNQSMLKIAVATVLFGVSILRSRQDPVWTGMVLVAGPLTFAGMMLASGSEDVARFANLVTAAALIVIGMRSMRGSGVAA